MGCIIGEYNSIQKAEIENDIGNNNNNNNENDNKKNKENENENENENYNDSHINTIQANILQDTNSIENQNLNNSNIGFRNSLFSINNINVNQNKKNENKEILFIKLSNETKKNYDEIIINQNILKSKKRDIKIVKNNLNPIIYTFGSKIPNNEKSISSSFSSSNPENEEEEIDFLIEDEINIKPHQFDIEIFNSKFYMKDFKNGNGIFLKIEKNISIEPEVKYTFLIYNNCYVDFIIQSNSNEVFIDVNNKNKEKFKYIEKKSIIIGKSKDNDIVLPYIEGISRIQLTFFYDEINENFFIYDGFYSIENNDVKPSTNGIWLLINSKFEIKNNMVFRAGKTYFKCMIKEIN